jgi:hypothetical protein
MVLIRNDYPSLSALKAYNEKCEGTDSLPGLQGGGDAGDKERWNNQDQTFASKDAYGKRYV